jgi:hypothetical protein
MSNRQLLEEARRIFNSLEKWNALFEIHGQTDAIITNWLTEGAVALRKDFAETPSNGWSCKRWEADNETKWFLTDLGPESIGLVYAWPEWEFHLIYKNPAAFDDAKARSLLKESKIERLVDKFNPDEEPAKAGGYRSLACDTKFNPFGGSTDRTARRRELAWYAAHETNRFVEEMSARVRRITDSDDLTKLIRELNQRAKSVSNG